MNRIADIGTDPLRWELDNLVQCLDYEFAKPFLKEDVTEKGWDEDKMSSEKDAVVSRMKDYIEFALGKAYNHRGLTAMRSVCRFRAWLWLAGDDKLFEFSSDNENYHSYGVPILKIVCDKYGLPFPKNREMIRMASGKSCRDGCDEGCLT